MNVSFTGMKIFTTIQNFSTNSIENKDKITLQLNNDGEKDLDDFKQVLKKYPDFYNEGYLDLELKSATNRNPGNLYNDVYVNSKKLELNDENLPIFSKINNLLKKISKNDVNPSNFDKSLDPQESQEIAGDVSKKLVKTLNDYCMSKPKDIFSGVKSVGGVSFTTPEKKINSLSLELNDEDKAVFKHYLEPLVELTYKGDDPILKMHDEQRVLDEIDGKIEPSQTTNDLNVIMAKNEANGETDIYLNDKKIEVNEKTIPVFSKLAQLMAKMSKTKEDIPFPKDYLGSESLDKISSGFLQRGQLEDISTMSGEEKENRGIEIDIVKSNSDAKYIAKNIFETIDKKMDTYYS